MISLFLILCSGSFLFLFKLDFVLAIEKLGLGEVGENMVKGIFAQIDTNNNGKLDLSEALQAYESIKAIFAQNQSSSQ